MTSKPTDTLSHAEDANLAVPQETQVTRSQSYSYEKAAGRLPPPQAVEARSLVHRDC